jgi:trk system potassium uptake protein TrkH
MQRYYPVIRVLSLVICMFGLTMLVPWALSWATQDGAESAFDEAVLLTVGTGLGLWYATRKEKRDLTIRDGFLMVALVWTVLPVYAGLPLMIQLNASFTDAYFEAVSGLTTTGATVFEGLDTLPVSINFWRCQLVWLGGMGLIVLAVAILPLLGIGGRQMFKAETPGPMKDSKMTPRMAETAKGLWVVYTLISICCTLGYRWAGMTWLDALMHMFSTMGLGGFSSHDASFGFFDSPAIEAVSIAFMLIAGCNFATHYVVLSGRSLRPYLTDPEAGAFLLVTSAVSSQSPSFSMCMRSIRTFSEALRFSAFNVVSIATTTGYANTDYALWPFFAPLWMLFLSSLRPVPGSTGGGIKMIRAIVLYKQVYRELTRAMHPNAVHPIKSAVRSCPPTFSSRCWLSASCTWCASCR